MKAWQDNSELKNWLCESKKGRTFVHCEVCDVNLPMGIGGKVDLKKHARGKKHLKEALETTPATDDTV